MQYHVLATDYDGTLADHGTVLESTVGALQACAKSGRKLVLVTGRELIELIKIFPELPLFDWVVAENGALLYRPATQAQRVLSPAPPEKLVAELMHRGVTPISVGNGIVATWEPHETTCLEVIRDLGVEYQVIFNKGAVMLLPSGINKASGLKVALAELGLSRQQTVGIGDAENDHALFDACALGVATANAVPSLKERADWVTAFERGAGVAQLIGRMLENDLADLTPKRVETPPTADDAANAAIFRE